MSDKQLTVTLSDDEIERVRQIAYGLETGYFRDDAPAVTSYALDAATFLRAALDFDSKEFKPGWSRSTQPIEETAP